MSCPVIAGQECRITSLARRPTEAATRIHGIAMVFVVFHIEVAQGQNLLDETAARPTAYVNNYVQRVCYVRLDGAVRHFNAVLQDTTSETRTALSRRTCVDRRKVSVEACAEEL